MEITEQEKNLILGCLNTTKLFVENNIHELENKNEPLKDFQRTALTYLKYQLEEIEKLYTKILKDVCEC